MYGGIEGALQGLAPVHKKGLQQTESLKIPT